MSDLIRVRSTSRSTAVAGAIAGIMRQQGHVEIQAIGAAAINQAIKAIAIARGYLEQDRIDLFMVPKFVNIEVEGEERTAVHLAVFRQIAPLVGPSAPLAAPAPEPEIAPAGR